MTRKQCKKCPWKVDVDPYDIPNGYSEKKHCALKSTIADGSGGVRPAALRIMACHEFPVGKEVPCVGWMVNQLGPGNNIGLRVSVAFGHISGDVKTVGEQHKCLEDTFPKSKRKVSLAEVKAAFETAMEEE